MALSARSQHLLFITLMVTAMSCVISLTLTIIKVGFDHSMGYLLNQWLKNWALAAIVAWPTAYIVVPAVKKIVAKLAK
jgi:ABC-type enterochelin transport system permease subunit